MKRFIFAAVAPIVFCACAPSLTMEGTRVKVLPSPEAATACEPISAVEVTEGGKDAAEIALRNKAGAMNANAVLIAETVEAQGKVKLIARAFGCHDS